MAVQCHHFPPQYTFPGQAQAQNQEQARPATTMGHELSKPNGEIVYGAAAPDPAAQHPQAAPNNRQPRKAVKSLTARTHISLPMLCPDWIWSSSSNICIAKDREWFSEYTPFRSTVVDWTGTKHAVVGIGNVNLPVKRYPNRTGRAAHGILPLVTVLHIPSFVCNILGAPPTDHSYTVTCQPMFAAVDPTSHASLSKGWITDIHNQPVAFFAPDHVLFAIKLSGPPIGPIVRASALKADAGGRMIWGYWAHEDREEWERAQVDTMMGGGGYEREETVGVTGEVAMEDEGVECDVEIKTKSESSDGGESYTILDDADSESGSELERMQSRGPRPPDAREKAWLRRHYGNEFRFLRRNGLNIYKEDEREKGSFIMRMLIRLEKSGRGLVWVDQRPLRDRITRPKVKVGPIRRPRRVDMFR
ncbi:hypothetical protein B0T19DRAFT_284883 [Cercophora scortea]|uniref:Uncharacterized protein n=1 Tax=Cercophora scortea TaxID=314031 RepID=A0AAE0I7Z3_9PEZI|nr:hypothetical protein B0T19DRAFT_284883 [Cercophora scortea]